MLPFHSAEKMMQQHDVLLLDEPTKGFYARANTSTKISKMKMSYAIASTGYGKAQNGIGTLVADSIFYTGTGVRTTAGV